MQPLPDAHGFASPFGGLVEGRPIVAGGANFPDESLWQGGSKVWHRRIFQYDPHSESWTVAGDLPIPLAYGSSFSLEDGLFLVGGQSDGEIMADLYRIRSEQDQLIIDRPLPPLPEPRMMAAGLLIGKTFYLAGGRISSTDDGSRDFLRLQLDSADPQWEKIERIPGEGRFLSAVAAKDGCLLLIGGVRVLPDGSLSFLKDVHKYDPSVGWTHLPSLRFPSAAAPSPAPVLSDGSVVLVGGTDGTLSGIDPSIYPKVPRRVQILHPGANEWVEGKDAPVARVGVPTISWRGGWIFPTGESSPGVRSPEVWFLNQQE